MHKINVLFVNPFSQEVSGPDESLLNLIKGLDHERFNMTVVLPCPGPYSEKYERAGAQVIYHRMVRIRRSLNPFYLIGFLFEFWIDVRWFEKIIRERAISLVHTNIESVLSSGLAARRAGAKSVYHVRGTSFATPKFLCDRIVRLIDRYSDEICVISRAVGDIFFSRGVREKVHIVYNAIDLSEFQSTSESVQLRRQWGVLPSERLVGAFGRVNPRKGLEVFIQAAARVKEKSRDVKFAIVGAAADRTEQSYAEQLRKLSDRLGLQEKMRFVCERKEAAAVLGAFDVLVFTSRNEGFGRVLIEAMAVKKPVVASKVGGVPEIIADRIHGRLVASNDPETIAEAVVDLLDHPDMARQMGENGRRRVEECFNLQKQVEVIENLYEKLVGHEETLVHSRN